jgi:excisionase family DNA binding protein
VSSESKLSPGECAAVLGVSADYIVGEIKEGRLPARERTYDSGRKRYRIDASDFAAYVREFWPKKERRDHPRTKVS